MDRMKKIFCDWALRVTVLPSMALGIFWTSGILIDEMRLGIRLNWYVYLALCAAVVSLFSLLIFRRNPRGLRLSYAMPFWKGIGWWVLLLAGGYVLLAFLSWWFAHLLVVWTWPNPRHSQAGLYKVIMAWWLPLWWLPAFSGIGLWLRFKK